MIRVGATKTLFGFISGPGAQHGKTTNLNNTLNRLKNPANKPKHFKNLDKQLGKYTNRLYKSALKDIKGRIVWDVITSLIDNAI